MLMGLKKHYCKAVTSLCMNIQIQCDPTKMLFITFWVILVKTDNILLTYIWKCKEPRRAKASMEKSKLE